MKTIEIKYPTEVPKPIKAILGSWPAKALLVILGLVYAPVLLVAVLGVAAGYYYSHFTKKSEKTPAEGKTNPYANASKLESKRRASTLVLE